MTTEIEVLTTLRALAITAGQRVEAAKVDGIKMRILRGLETEHRVAWGHYYAVDCRLHTLIGATA